MPKPKARYFVVALALAVVLGAALFLWNGRVTRVEALVAQGRALVQKNCNDCADATEEGLRRGIENLEEAIDAGVGDDPETLKALETGYNTLLMLHLQPDSDEYKDYQERMKAINQRILARDPNNVEALFEYAANLDDKDDQVAALERIVELDPTHAAARHALGVLLYERGQKEEAIEQMKLAVRNATEPDDFSYYVRLRDFLTSEGRLQEAEEFAGRFGNRYNPS